MAAAATTQRDGLTLAQLLNNYNRNHLEAKRPEAARKNGYQIGVIARTEVPRLDGTPLAFGDWLVADITASTLESFRRPRAARGVTAGNRDLV